MDVRLDKGKLDTRQNHNILKDGLAIIQKTKLTFDPGDKSNASLYLCDPSNGNKSEYIHKAISRLIEAGLWSNETPKSVREDQKDIYATQLEFVEAVEFQIDGVRLFAARYNHPKFSSSAERYEAWKKALELRA